MRHAGSAYRLKDGSTVPFSVLGVLDPTLAVPYHPGTEFPFRRGGTHARGQALKEPLTECAHTAHFMAMCSKLIYEDDSIIRNILQDRCMLSRSCAQLCAGIGPRTAV